MQSTIKIQFFNGKPVVQILMPVIGSSDARDTLMKAFVEEANRLGGISVQHYGIMYVNGAQEMSEVHLVPGALANDK